MSEIITERVISVVGSHVHASTEDMPKESSLKEETFELETTAEEMIVTNDDEYQDAAEFGKKLKTKAVDVKNFFSPMKEAAYKAHKAVCDREKAMLEPLAKAGRIVKQAMGAYLSKREEERRKAEDAARKAAEEESNRRLAEAIALEKQGKAEEAEAVAMDAEIYDTAASTLSVGAPTPKISGVSSKRDWEIVKIDDATVPINFSGFELRPVDNAAIMRIIRASKGSIKIPGVTYREIATMSFSSRRS